MSAAAEIARLKPPAQERAGIIFRALKEISRTQTDRMFAWLVAFEWMAAMAAALLVSARVLPAGQPMPFAGTASAAAGMLYLFPLYLALRCPGRAMTRHVVAASQMMTPALFIYLTGGAFEPRFFVFGALAALASYRDAWILVSATVVVAGDHVLSQLLQTVVDGGHPASRGWVGFPAAVLFEDTVLFLWIRESLRLMNHAALHQAQQQVLHEAIEKEAADRLEALHQDAIRYQQKQDLLQKSEARFRTLGESAPDSMFLADPFGQWVYCNSIWTKLTGLTATESLGHGWIRVLHPDDKDQLLEQWNHALRERKGLSRQFRLLSAAGRVRWVSCRIAPIQSEPDDPGESGGFAGSITDLSSCKEAGDALRRAKTGAEAAFKAKGEFLAKMSHEIRTPLNGVIGMAKLLSDTDITPRQREYTGLIQRSAESFLLLINDVLDFSKAETRKLIFETVDFNLQETVEGSLELLADTAQARNLELAGFVPADLPTRLRGDPGRLRQVLLNLVGNAVKFTEHGRVLATVARLGETETDVDLRFEVRDTGIGIPAEIQPRLFQAFSPADSPATLKQGGPSLGLAISKRLIELMGGQIGFTSVPGQGSTFWFTARFEKRPTQAKTAPAPANSGNLQASQRLRFGGGLPDSPSLSRIGTQCLTTDYRGNDPGFAKGR